ncbi:hypothetical protein CCMSSC00406_0010219 [Pleurotus cornucopiae]|uniref:Uncharacterized protein n=1 Tax=Pleurotus cornucopiae TaxID=5321 RepID=A0ACB7IIY6_PLECO|nr:hypothetical protein CCMSSC00406_0010219 [Pleurotus cornucopiae]
MFPIRRSAGRIRHAAAKIHAKRTLLTHSYVEGPLHPPLSTATLPQFFETEVLPRYAERPALVCRTESPRVHGGSVSWAQDGAPHLAWDFQEFDRHINALARGLLSMGVRKGDRVGVLMGNNSAYANLQWACASIGAILVTINPAYRLHELVKTLTLVGVKHLFVVPSIRSSAYVEMLASAYPDLRESRPGSIQEEALPELRNLVVFDKSGNLEEMLDKLKVKCAVDWREIMAWREDTSEARMQHEITHSLEKDDVINLQFTSGTTGLPKAVSLTHSNLLNNGLSIGRCMNLSEVDVLCNLAAWTHGACIVYASDIYDPKLIVDAVSEEICTALHGVPTHFLGVLAEVEKRRAEGEILDFSRLRTGIAAGSPIPIDLMRSLISKLNLRDLTNAFGMTETSPVSFQTTPADPIIKRVETVGRVQPHVKAKLIDEEGKVVPVGTPGEVSETRLRYWEDEEQTRAVMRWEGDTLWMHTGDEGIMDEEGYLRIVGRRKDIIIRGGENLFPVQIENALTEHPSVREAAVVSVPDPKYGEVVGAWIVREPNTHIDHDQVRRTVAESMNPQNAPAWVWFVGEDGTESELPKTASGKVMKHILRNWARDLSRRSIGGVRI